MSTIGITFVIAWVLGLMVGLPVGVIFGRRQADRTHAEERLERMEIKNALIRFREMRDLKNKMMEKHE